MDVLLLPTSVYAIPSAHRAGAIVFDGAFDLTIADGPGPDRELLRAYGDGLEDLLDVERRQLPGGRLAEGTSVRIHPGRLRCDFLAWVATRPPEVDYQQPPAPGPELSVRAIEAALRFAGEQGAVRVAFGPLGVGVGAPPPEARLARVAEVARAFDDRCFAEGHASPLEEVLVCADTLAIFQQVRSRLGSQVRALGVAAAPMRDESSPKRAPSRASGGGAKGKRAPTKPTLDAADVARARSTANPYDMRTRYAIGEWFLHPRFGVGRVEQVTPEGAIVVLFDDGTERKMVHARG